MQPIGAMTWGLGTETDGSLSMDMTQMCGPKENLEGTWARYRGMGSNMRRETPSLDGKQSPNAREDKSPETQELKIE